MNLKDAYRYSKFVDSLISTINRNFHYSANFIKTVETHKKTLADANAVDEIVNVITEKTFDCDIKGLLKVINMLITEKAKLSISIDNAKSTAEVDWKEDGVFLSLDSAINVNKSYRDLAERLAMIKDVKNKNHVKSGIGYRINNEGNQTTYRYNIDTVDTIDFDREFVLEEYKKLLTKADKISSAIEEVMASDIVKFDPKFSLYDTDKDIIAKYAS